MPGAATAGANWPRPGVCMVTMRLGSGTQDLGKGRSRKDGGRALIDTVSISIEGKPKLGKYQELYRWR